MADDRCVEEKITAIYHALMPEKVEEIPDLLEKYAGKEKKLLKAIMKKYELDEVPPSPAEDEDDDADEDEDDEVTIITKKILAIYKAHLPDKISDIPLIMEKYEGKESKLLKAVLKKYGLTEAPDISGISLSELEEAKAEEDSGEDDEEDEEDEDGEEDDDEGTGDGDDGDDDPVEKAYIKMIRDRIVYVYKKCAPEKIAGIDSILKKYHGNEAQLLNAVEKKYGVSAPAEGDGGEDDEDNEEDEDDEEGGGGAGHEDEDDDLAGLSGDALVEAKYVKVFKDRIKAIYKVQENVLCECTYTLRTHCIFSTVECICTVTMCMYC